MGAMRYRAAIAKKDHKPVNGVQIPQVDSVEDAVAHIPEAVLVKAINDQFSSWALNWARGQKSVIGDGVMLKYTPTGEGGTNMDDMSILASLKVQE